MSTFQIVGFGVIIKNEKKTTNQTKQTLKTQFYEVEEEDPLLFVVIAMLYCNNTSLQLHTLHINSSKMYLKH